ncbi:hypothetical protein NTE_01399 [Candidatus Nitrososphaera evergladensis SR1]|uniref:Uncharacterized protein n=1 Tax=Candidatus Nitrososphaera evergladensis SR1 TaxID=1459636 RepID=A0A075MPI4_9ARCH|nr:hypothetical protein [Candidatus Nitrososphaera evergladensis]AIF83466.1 hypothetical protein NTE_01399 [Candidatus Nitrososphaera evergladensis SR1]
MQHIFKVTKSVGEATANLELYDGNSLALLESESFSDLYTLNFHLQTLATKYKTAGGLLIVHDKAKNSVELSLAKDENSLFVS